MGRTEYQREKAKWKKTQSRRGFCNYILELKVLLGHGNGEFGPSSTSQWGHGNVTDMLMI